MVKRFQIEILLEAPKMIGLAIYIYVAHGYLISGIICFFLGRKL